MDVEEASPTFSPPAVSGRESADPNDQADMPTPGAGKKKKEADAAPFIYSILTRDSPGGQIAIMHSRVRDAEYCSWDDYAFTFGNGDEYWKCPEA